MLRKIFRRKTFRRLWRRLKYWLALSCLFYLTFYFKILFAKWKYILFIFFGEPLIFSYINKYFGFLFNKNLPKPEFITKIDNFIKNIDDEKLIFFLLILLLIFNIFSNS